ncbi:transmembrane protein 273 isoform X1 [Callorhinus ursinus]|uniref:Transmembrane protein 273 n=2 Tax=Callorhinus ursinus TaxID=34884 RepID=A0A3Q7R744_CALUR|nr:putative uncharacterized protein C10orf128 homolog isoform X1 [Callorhinus ursinus]
MGLGANMLRAVLLLLDVGGAPVLATGKSAGAEIDIKYAIIGTALGVVISAVFLVLKICMIRKHLFDIYSSDLRSTNPGFNDTITLKKRVPRSQCFTRRSAEKRLERVVVSLKVLHGCFNEHPILLFCRSNLNFSKRDEQVIEL